MCPSNQLTGLEADSPNPTPSEILDWLEAFAIAIRNANFEAGFALFASDVVAFGTVGVMLRGLEDLAANQWQRVWTVTSGFRFHLERLSWQMSADIAWIAVPWTSQGRTGDGNLYDRHGRATYVLRRRDRRWIAVHSHHSLDPVK